MTKVSKYFYSALALWGVNFCGVAQAIPTCDPSASLTNGSACYLQPTEKTMKIYSIYLCSSAPSAPTSIAPIGISSCTKIFGNSSGTTMTLTAATATNPLDLRTGNTATVPNQNTTASHVYVEFSPIDSFKATQQFGNVQTGTDATTGNYCWTTTSTSFVISNTPPASTCGNASTPGGTQTQTLNSLGGTGPFSAVANFNNQGPTLDVTRNAYLMTATAAAGGTLGTGTTDSLGNITVLGAVFPLGSTMQLNPIRGLNVLINYSWGAEAFRVSAGRTFFGTGPLTVKFSAR